MQPYITLPKACFFDNGVCDAGILEDMLAYIGIHFEDTVSQLGARAFGVWPLCSIVALLSYGLRHDGRLSGAFVYLTRIIHHSDINSNSFFYEKKLSVG